MRPTVPDLLGHSLQRALLALPRGRGLAAAVWRPRHRCVVVVLWAQTIALPVAAAARSTTLGGVLLQTTPIVLLAAASLVVRWRALAIGCATAGLLGASALLGRLSGDPLTLGLLAAATARRGGPARRRPR
jgi:hypothetical protein